MRVLDRFDPRQVALLLVPVLLAAGAAQPEPRVPRAAAVLASHEAGAALPMAEAAAPAVVAAVEAPAALPVVAARGEARASRTALRRDRAPVTPEERGSAALRALAFDPASLGYRVRFLPHRAGELGSTNRRTRTITVHVRPGQSELVLRTTLAHELGHALDFVHGTPERRSAYREARRLPAGPWFPCDRCDDLASPAGDFAEVFALWLAGPGDFRGRLAGPPSAAELRELAPLLRVPSAAVRAAGPAAPSPTPQPTQEPRPGLPALLGPPASPGPGRG